MNLIYSFYELNDQSTKAHIDSTHGQIGRSLSGVVQEYPGRSIVQIERPRPQVILVLIYINIPSTKVVVLRTLHAIFLWMFVLLCFLMMENSHNYS